jgi:heat shock protein 1/8
MCTVRRLFMAVALVGGNKGGPLQMPTDREMYDGAIGIDLGTTYSCVGVWETERVEIIANDRGNRKTPSCVAFTDVGRLYGEDAKNMIAMYPTTTVYGAKRLIGRRFSDPLVQADMKHWPFKVVTRGNDDQPLIEVCVEDETKQLAPEEIIAMVLCKMKHIAECYLGKLVKKAVITVPASFNDSQRQATKDAGTIAGLEVLRLISEHTAVAFTYRLDQMTVPSSPPRNVVVFDFGGGTCSVTLVTIESDVFEVKATAGDPRLGGDDIDRRMVHYFVDVIRQRYKGANITSNPRAMRRLQTACERAKWALSVTAEATIDVDSLIDGIDFQASISRTDFEELCDDMLRSPLTLVERVLTDSSTSKDAVHDVVLVGGSSRIPKVRQLLSSFFDGKPLSSVINPEEAAARGAASAAFLVSGSLSLLLEPILTLDVTPQTLGIGIGNGNMHIIARRHALIPTKHVQTFSTYADN